MGHFQSRRILGKVTDKILVPIIDDMGGESIREVEAYIEWSYATKSLNSGAYMDSHISYVTYTRVNGKWQVVSDLSFRKQLAGPTEKLQKMAEEQAQTSIRDRNLREGRIPKPSVIPDFGDWMRST